MRFFRYRIGPKLGGLFRVDLAGGAPERWDSAAKRWVWSSFALGAVSGFRSDAGCFEEVTLRDARAIALEGGTRDRQGGSR